MLIPCRPLHTCEKKLKSLRVFQITVGNRWRVTLLMEKDVTVMTQANSQFQQFLRLDRSEVSQ